MQKIIIVGGGLSGLLVAANLLRRYPHYPAHITVVEKNPLGELGQAYSTDHSFHLLNVAAHKMSAFPEEMEGFTRWLTASGYPYNGHSYVPRNIYKQYIFDTIKKVLSAKGDKLRCTFLNDRVVDLKAAEQLLVLGSGRVIPFDKVILALGNFEATTLRLADNDYLNHPAYFPTSWGKEMFKGLSSTGNVLIIGSGLSMVDTVLYLHQRRHKGPVTALSTHGLTPKPHQEGPPYSLDGFRPEQVGTALEALKMVRRHVEKARQLGMDWHSVVNAIRPYSQEIWLQLTVAEKRKFMEHLRHFWGVARHRLPNECSEILNTLIRSGQLSIVAGRIRAILVNQDNSFTVDYKGRYSQNSTILAADAIINCMGPESNYERLEDPLIKNLLRKRLIRTDPLKLGIDCTPEGIVLEGNGQPSPFLYTIGPPTKGVLWESTSVPEIRVAAVRLSDLVTSTINELV